jgi:hypothetical protein
MQQNVDCLNAAPSNIATTLLRLLMILLALMEAFSPCLLQDLNDIDQDASATDLNQSNSVVLIS